MADDLGGPKAAVVWLMGLAALAGDTGVTIACATVGACVALTGTETPTRWDGARAVLRWVAASVICTGVVTVLVAKYSGLELDLLRGPVAFGLAMMGDRWRDLPGMVMRVVDRLLPKKEQS